MLSSPFNSSVICAKEQEEEKDFWAFDRRKKDFCVF